MAKEIKAHITGTVWKITTAVGSTVGEGDSVVILESMKMEMPVESEHQGVVDVVLIREGETVQEGQVLVRLK